MTSPPGDREAIPDLPNPLGLDGIEFVEFATDRPQAMAAVLQQMGFQAVARHRSREVMLYRQGSMNMIVNSSTDDARVSAVADGHALISAVAFRVKDARQAHARCLELGAWEVPSHAQAMELHIPAIQGPGGSRFFFVDRWHEFSIYDVDFVPIPGVERTPPALADLRYFGVVQYIGPARSDDWLAYLSHMFGFVPIPDAERFGILPKGKLMRSPCAQFLWQLIEPEPWMEQADHLESLQRVGLGTPDVIGAVAKLKERGVEFIESVRLHPEDRGALTRRLLGSVAFELVHLEA